MKNIIENKDDQFANSQITRDLRVNSEATEPQTQLEVVNVIEQCPDMALEEFSASTQSSEVIQKWTPASRSKRTQDSTLSAHG
jgi:hypothetical protein